MSNLKKMMNTPMGEIQALIAELVLWGAALMFFYDSEVVAGVVTLLIIELRHFRYLWQVKNN